MRGLQEPPSQSESAQLAQASPPVMPPLPKAAANVTPNPTFETVDVLAFLRVAVIRPPSSQVRAPVVPQLLAAQTLTASPHVPYFGLESFHTRRGHFSLPFRADPKSEELPFPRSPHAALGRVDFQP